LGNLSISLRCGNSENGVLGDSHETPSSGYHYSEWLAGSVSMVVVGPKTDMAVLSGYTYSNQDWFIWNRAE
jgi:hypothetical protein